MRKKMIIGFSGLILVLAAIPVISGFAADKAKEKMEALKQPTDANTIQQHGRKPDLLDQLIAAYKADDKKALGDIITKMEKRREMMRKFARFERWHQMAHQRMMMQQGWGWQHGFNGGGCGGCPGMQMNRNWGPPMGGFGPMPQFRQMPGGCGAPQQGNQCPMQGGKRACPQTHPGGDKQQPNDEQTPPPQANPGAAFDNGDQHPDLDAMPAFGDEEFSDDGPDNEVALDDDSPADTEW